MRYESIIQLSRVALEGVEIGGRLMRWGDGVVALTGSAGRDPRCSKTRRKSTSTVRPPGPHFSGSDPHRCLGSHLVRVELRVVLEELHKAIPDYHIGPGTPFPASWVTSGEPKNFT